MLGKKQETKEETVAEAISRIRSSILGGKFLKEGVALSLVKSEEKAKLAYLEALVEQNFVMIEQLEHIEERLQLIEEGYHGSKK